MNLQGIWRSVYSYPSSKKGETVRSEHRMEANVEGHRLTLCSVPDDAGSVVTVDLLIEGAIATGAWRERTSPDGDHAGKESFGAIQLWVREDGQALQGKWVGFGSKPGEMNSGDWEFTRSLEQSTE